MRKHHHYSITQHNNLRVERSALARKLSLVNILIHRDTPPAMMKLCCHFQYKQNRNITTIIQLWRYCHNYYYCFWFLFRWLTSPELLQVRLGPPNTYSWKLLEHIFLQTICPFHHPTENNNNNNDIYKQHSLKWDAKTRTSEMLNHYPCATVHRNAAIFKLVQALDRILLPYKLQDNISNGSRVHKQSLFG